MKEQYITMRNSQELDDNWLWWYYKQEGGKLNNSQEFLENFYTKKEPIIFNGIFFGEQRVDRDLSNFFNDMDRKFGLTTLWSAEGNFLKVVE